MSNTETRQQTPFPFDGFVRAVQIYGDTDKGIPAFFPISRAGWFAGVKDGKYPRPIKHGGVTFWKAQDIRKLVDDLSTPQEAA